MKGLLIALIILMALTLGLSNAQTDGLAGSSLESQVAQPLVREGTLAARLAPALSLGGSASETEAESVLSEAGIEPRNGWIADYPVTPDIFGELQAAISDAADSGKLATGKDAALKILQDVSTGYGLSIKADNSAGESEASAPNYPDSGAIENYYSDEGPPMVTYYAPPPDYAYLYTWVPYPFWGSDVWFPGFFVLGDFDKQDRRQRRGEHFSNHFHDPRTGGTIRIDPSNRFHGGTLPYRGNTGWSAPSSQTGVQAVTSGGRGRTVTEAPAEFRGYGVSRPSAGTRTSGFDHSVNSQVDERRASDRGFQSRSNAGQMPTRSTGGGGRASGGGNSGFHGGGQRNYR